MGGQSIGSGGSDDDLNLETDEIGREFREAIVSALRIAVLDADALSLDPSEVAQTEPECLVRGRVIGRREAREHSYAADCWRRLRACRARPSERAGSERKEQVPTTCGHAIPFLAPPRAQHYVLSRLAEHTRRSSGARAGQVDLNDGFEQDDGDRSGRERVRDVSRARRRRLPGRWSRDP